jgi:hypothetical protein
MSTEQNMGVKYDTDKLRYDLVPPKAFEKVVWIYTIGAKKYEPWNWRKGMSWSRVFGALMRHAWAWAAGKRFNKESTGITEHMAAVAWCALALLEYESEGIGVDDRPAVKDAKPEYLAGLLDGEGFFEISKTEQGLEAIVTCDMTRKEPVEALSKRYGGCITEIKTHEKQDPIYAWNCPDNSLLELLADVLPFMLIKREQALLLIEFIVASRYKNNTRMEDLYSKMWKLHKGELIYGSQEESSAENCKNKDSETSRVVATLH